MKNLLVSLSVIGSLAMATAALAEGECDKYTTSYDRTYCFAKLFVDSDQELNAVYKGLRDTLKGEIRVQLTSAQRDWLKYRDNSCSQGSAINVDCNYEANRKRAEFLRDRLRECRVGTCRNDVIIQRNWN